MTELQELCRQYRVLERRACFWHAMYRIRPTSDNAEALARFYSSRAQARMVALVALTKAAVLSIELQIERRS